MNKKAAITFVCIYIFMYILNYLHPMSFGDDYLYSFIWQGKPMSEPLSETQFGSHHGMISLFPSGPIILRGGAVR